MTTTIEERIRIMRISLDESSDLSFRKIAREHVPKLLDRIAELEAERDRKDVEIETQRKALWIAAKAFCNGDIGTVRSVLCNADGRSIVHQKFDEYKDDAERWRFTQQNMKAVMQMLRTAVMYASTIDKTPADELNKLVDAAREQQDDEPKREKCEKCHFGKRYDRANPFVFRGYCDCEAGRRLREEDVKRS